MKMIDLPKNNDKLDDLFELQKKFQARLSKDKPENFPKEDPAKLPMTITSIVAELGEILENNQKWKDWRDNPPEIDKENQIEEIVDFWHFVINLTLYLGYDAEEVYEKFIEKNKKNHKRQNNNY